MFLGSSNTQLRPQGDFLSVNTVKCAVAKGTGLTFGGGGAGRGARRSQLPEAW